MHCSTLEWAAHSKLIDFNNHRVIRSQTSQMQVWGPFLGPLGSTLPPQRALGPLKMAGFQCHSLPFPANHLWKEKKSLWTHSILSQRILFSNVFLVRPSPTHWNSCRACPVLHKRGLRIASGYCEERTRGRTRRGVSHRRPEVHHGLSVRGFRLSYASHCSCKEKATVLPEFPFPVPNGCDRQPQDPNCHSPLEIMRLPWQKPRVKATSHNTKG